MFEDCHHLILVEDQPTSMWTTWQSVSEHHQECQHRSPLVLCSQQAWLGLVLMCSMNLHLGQLQV